MKKHKLLIIDDEPQSYDTFSDRYEDFYTIKFISNAIRAIPIISKGEWDAVVLDLNLGKGYQDGLSRILPKAIEKAVNRFPILAYSSDNRPQTSILVKKTGAAAFLHKSNSSAEILHQKIEEVISNFNPLTEEEALIPPFVAHSKSMLDIQKRLRTSIKYPHLPVLLLGETGVGKEVAAKYIHAAKKNVQLSYEAVNLSAFSADLIRSEIYGHVKGAFTGANSDKKGLFALAKEGTLLLDEIGEISEPIQVQLLRTLEDRTYKQVGGLIDHQLDTHLIFATNRNLKKAIEDGTFRADFYERISSLIINIPPLRERKEDILPLMKHFLAKSCPSNHPFNNRPVEEAFTKEALEKMYNYTWPSNIRQLANVIQKLVFEVDVRSLDIIDESILPKTILFQTPISKKDESSPNVATTNGIPSNHNWSMDKQTANDQLTQIENVLIQEGGRKDDAARRLGLKNDQALRYKIKKKYYKNYPELFEDFPTIRKIYKLN